MLLGNMVGFCFTNMLEACYFFTIPDSQYLEYIIPQILFMIGANFVPFIVFDYFLSFCGAYFFIKGFMILVGNDQIAEVKMFLAEKEFYTWEIYQENLNRESDLHWWDRETSAWFIKPVIYSSIMLVVFGISCIYKTRKMR